MNATGFIIDGKLVAAPDGMVVMNEHDAEWCKLDAGDYTTRTEPVHMFTAHTTKGIWPQRIIPGKGVPGRAQLTADFWRGDPQHSAAQLVIDRDGTIACLGDLLHKAAYHATTVNGHTIGVEMYQEPDGGVYEATIDAAVKLAKFVCSFFGFAFQTTSRVYHENTIIERLKLGGADVVGVFGHRDNAWTFPAWMTPEQRAKYPNGFATRGRGDPGDEFYTRCIAAGAEAFDIDAREELTTWKRRQSHLNSKFGEKLTVDGVAMKHTIDAMHAHGFADGRAVDASIAA